MQSQANDTISDAECLKRIAAEHSEATLPGYWTNLEANCAQWAKDVAVAAFWTEANQLLGQWRTEYRASTDADLLMGSALPNFVGKSEASIKDKVFRHCRRSPDAIADVMNPSPPLPRLNDLVRTRVVCTFMDGVEFIATKLEKLASKHGILVERSREGRVEGYYAQHINVSHEVIYELGGTKRIASITIEIQVASAMATRMWEVGHVIYANIRGQSARPENWQWSALDARFIPHQLGHMIHLADGLLVQIREGNKVKK